MYRVLSIIFHILSPSFFFSLTKMFLLICYCLFKWFTQNFNTLFCMFWTTILALNCFLSIFFLNFCIRCFDLPFYKWFISQFFLVYHLCLFFLAFFHVLFLLLWSSYFCCLSSVNSNNIVSFILFHLIRFT